LLSHFLLSNLFRPFVFKFSLFIPVFHGKSFLFKHICLPGHVKILQITRSFHEVGLRPHLFVIINLVTKRCIYKIFLRSTHGVIVLQRLVSLFWTEMGFVVKMLVVIVIFSSAAIATHLVSNAILEIFIVGGLDVCIFHIHHVPMSLLVVELLFLQFSELSQIIHLRFKSWLRSSFRLLNNFLCSFSTAMFVNSEWTWAVAEAWIRGIVEHIRNTMSIKGTSSVLLWRSVENVIHLIYKIYF